MKAASGSVLLSLLDRNCGVELDARTLGWYEAGEITRLCRQEGRVSVIQFRDCRGELVTIDDDEPEGNDESQDQKETATSPFVEARPDSNSDRGGSAKQQHEIVEQ